MKNTSRPHLCAAAVTAAVTVLCFAANLGGAAFGNPADAWQLALTLLYAAVWGVFSVRFSDRPFCAKAAFLFSLLTFISALSSLFCRLTDSGFIIAALLSVFASVPFYGLRFFMDWTGLYATVFLLAAAWLAFTFQKLKRL